MEFGSRLYKLRKEKGLRQEDLANLLSVSRQTIIAIENGKYNPSLLLALKIAQIFDKPVEAIFELEKEYNLS